MIYDTGEGMRIVAKGIIKSVEDSRITLDSDGGDIFMEMKTIKSANIEF